MTSNNNVLIVSLVALTTVVIAAIVALAIWGSPSNAVVTGATGQIVTLVTLISGILVTMKVSVDAKAAAVEATDAAKVATVEAVKSKDASRENSQALAEVKQAVVAAVDGVDTIHGIVNHQKDLITNELAESRKTNEALTAELAGVHAALLASQTSPGSKVAAKLADAIPVHPVDTPTPAADAAKAEDARKPPTTTKRQSEIVPPPDEPRARPGEHS